MLIKNADKDHWSAKNYFNLYVWAGTSKEVFINNRDIIDLVYEAIFEQQKEIREGISTND